MFSLLSILGLTTAKLVPLHHHDGYSECVNKYNHRTVYCVSKTYIKPADRVPAWREIVTHNSHQQNHFRYDSLLRSICIPDCETKLSQLNNTDDLIISKFDIDPSIYYPAPVVDKTTPLHRETYGKVVSKCTNLELREYGLKGYTEIDFCLVQEEIDDTNAPYDPLNLFCVLVILVLAGCCFLSTCFDCSLPGANDNPQHYEKLPAGVSKSLLAFSIPRNWAAFTYTTQNDNNNAADSFDYFEGLRILVMSLNTIVHTFGTLASVSLINPQDYEALSYKAVYKVFTGATFTNQIYFTFAGFLLTLSTVKDIKRGKVLQPGDLWDALKRRYVRLTPMLAMVLLLDMTLVRKLYSGPIWTQLAGYDEAFCRSNWWTNLLYINNFVKTGQICMLHSKLILSLFIIVFSYGR